MGAFVANSAFTGGYVGTTPVEALYLGTDLIWANPMSGYTFHTEDGVTSYNNAASFQISNFNPQLPDFHARIKAHILGRSVFTNGNDTKYMLSDPDGLNPLVIMYGSREQYGEVGQYRAYLLTYMGNGSAVKVGYQYNIDPFNKDIDWTIYPQGLYDNDTDEWIGTTPSASTLPNSEIIISFRYIAWKEIQIWQGSTLLFDGKAAIRKSDDGGGLYDVVSNTFYTDAQYPERVHPYQ